MQPIKDKKLTRLTTVDYIGDARIDFVLIATGDCMTGARIHDGDLVFIQRQTAIENGQIAAVELDGQRLLKRFYQYGDLIVLHPENPAYRDIEIRRGDGHELTILGRAVSFQSVLTGWSD